MDWREKLGKAQQLADQVKEILAKPDAPAEDMAKIKPMLEEAKKLQGEAAELKDIMADADKILAEKDIKRSEPPKPGGRVEWKDWKEYLEAIWYATHKSPAVRKDDPRLVYFRDDVSPGDKKILQEGVGASGGFLVPTEFMTQ